MRGKWPVLALLCVAQFVVVLDVTIVAIALPGIRADLGFSTAGLQWVVSAYTLVFGGLLMLAGRAADLYGRRRLFVVGLAVFAGASLLCGLAESPAFLVAARVLQGAGAAIVSPSALSALTAAFPEGEGRGAALGVWTAAAAGGGAAGWVLGGALVGGLGWEWVFLVNVPVGMLGMVLAPFLLAESRDPAAPPRLDVWGAATGTAGLVLLVYGLTRAEALGLGVGSLGLSTALLGAFVVVEGRVRHPLVPLGALRSRRLAGANVVALLVTASTTPPMFLCTLYAQEVLGLAPLAAGLLFAPVNLAVIAGSLLGPQVVGAVGERASMAAGLVGVAVGVLLLLGLSPEGGAGRLLPAFVIMGAGLGLASVASTAAGTSAAGTRQGLASGLLNSSAQVGTALGLAVLVPLAAHVSADSGTPAALVAGYRWAFVGAAGLALAGALVAPLLVAGKR